MLKYIRKNSEDFITVTPLTPFDVECIANLHPDIYEQIQNYKMSELYLARTLDGKSFTVYTKDVLDKDYVNVKNS